jgi:hypothetical protein
MHDNLLDIQVTRYPISADIKEDYLAGMCSEIIRTIANNNSRHTVPGRTVEEEDV